jgi:hypothetical protein
VQLYDVVGEINGLFTGAGDVEDSGILAAVVGSKVVARQLLLLPRPLDTPLNALDFVDDDIVHTA